MLDNLRDQASSTPFFQDDDDLLPPEEVIEVKKRSPLRIPSLGLSAPQRFFLSVMFLTVVCLLGVMFLLVTGRIALPFF